MKTYTTLLALAAAVNAHMIMRSPIPFNQPDSSPLDGSGSNFPCKISGGSGDVASGPTNAMTIGQANTLSFTGSAVHGGGSCQVAIAKGTQINANTKWMVIHSIEGGCPADTTASGGGNLPADPNGTGAATFQFTIPDHPDIPLGNNTLAWTWHNRIGNREMYMNCALVKISPAAKKRYAPTSFSKRQQAPLPDIFKANIGNGCATVEGTDVKYPDAGSSLEVGKDAKLGDPVGSCGSSGSSSPSQPSGAAQPSGGAAAATSAAATAANTVVPQPSAPHSPISQSVGGGFATVSASGAASPTAAATQAPSAPQASAPPASLATPATSPAAPLGTGTSSTPSTGTSGSCNVGDWNCASDGKSFQRCIAGGTWSASIQMSQGLSCTPGISSNFAYNLTGASAKRDLRSHISRRRSNLHGAVLS